MVGWGLVIMRLRVVAVIVGAVLAFTVAGCGRSDPRWTGPDGRRVPDGRVRDGVLLHSVSMAAGPEHCGWQRMQFLTVSWPLGSTTTGFDESLRLYVWDPDGTDQFGLQGTRAVVTELPSDARDTGYHRRGVRLWFATSDADRYAYLQQRDGTFQRWPKAAQLVGCA